MTRIVPAEWEAHAALWLGFPSHENLWQDDLIPAQAEVAALARVLAEMGDERVRLLVMGDDAATAARTLLGDVSRIDIVDGRFGDIWLRDTGPIYTALERDRRDVAHPTAFTTNGWGGKYHLMYDDEVADQIAARDFGPAERFDFVLEGGALDHDGHGTALTTRQCLLNANRNSDWTVSLAEKALFQSLGVRKVIWLDDGLVNDHTDGHVDNLARFVAPGVVAIPSAFGADDPNAAIYEAAARVLSQQTDSRGQPLQVVRLPSPGLMTNESGEVVPASHMNFLIANDCVVVPIYEKKPGDLAVEVLQSLFPERTVVGLSSRAILTGGGSFHCISQQVPLVK